MIAARGPLDDRSGGRTGSRAGRHLEWLRADRTGLLAVSLSLLTVLSLFAIPASGASLAGSGPAASVDDGASGPDPLAKGGPPGGNGGGNGSSAGGGGSGGESTSDQGTGSSSAGSSGDGGSNGGSSVGADDGDGSTGAGSGDESSGDGAATEDGASDGNGGSNAGESAGSSNGNGNGKADGGGSSSASGPPGSAGKGGNWAPEVDVSVPGGPGAEGQSNAGGPGGTGPPDKSNAGGNGDDGHGPPEAPPGEAGGGGPSVSVTAAAGGERGGGAGLGAFGGQPPDSVVSVAVENARAGDRVDLDVSPASVENDAVAFDGISMTVERDGDFTMRVTNSRGRLSGSPAFEPDQAAEPLGRIRLDHSITNDEVEEVTYRFRVSKARLEATDTDPEEVALFRHADGGWNELPTDVVGETESHYLLSSDSPGMSEFAVGAKRPDFDTFWADVGAGSVGSGEAVTVRGRVTNDGGADGVYDARLVVDGEVVAERSITIAAGGTRQVNFRAELERPGARHVSINGVPAGEVTVEPRQDDSEADDAEPAMAVLIDRILDVSNALGITSAPADDG